ncbi:MAG: FHA domain-containing protein [Polyangiaceae bacterium]|nr:FHA domain-containing protein [Polyangiaceae bacterium]
MLGLPMGLFDLFSRGKDENRKKAARAKELAGDLEGAVEAYLDANLTDDAARVLLLRADAERSPEKRMAFCALALSTATDVELQKKARGRKALLGFDLLKGKGASVLTSEVLGVARELEEADELERAADAYALAGDTEGEVRVLTAAGAIERLEERLRATEMSAKSENERVTVLRKIADFDRTAERRSALSACDAWLAKHHDEKVAGLALAIRARLLRGPIVDLVVDGERRRFVIGGEVTLGRDGTIPIGARAVSRKHVRLFREGGAAMVEDLGTRNGTTLAGARLMAPVPVGDGITIKLGGEIPCVLTPLAATEDRGALIEISVSGDKYYATLGTLSLFGWHIVEQHDGAASYVVLRTPAGGMPPFLGEYQLAHEVELCAGDAIAKARGGRARLTAPGDQPRLDAPA